MSVAIGFDLYGTLLSTVSISQELAKLYGEEKAKTIATQARRYQLEYTWRINSMGMYRSFSDMTRVSFRHAAAEAGVHLSAEDEERILKAYDGLDTFPDAGAAMDILSATPSLNPWVFSNGTISMVTSSIKSSPSLSKASSVLPSSKVISVDSLRAFKPSRQTYDYLVEKTGMQHHRDKVWLVSSNPFDVVGAAAVGLKTAWVDRGGLGWQDGLGVLLDLRPTVVVKGVDEAVQEIMRMEGLRR